MKICLTDPVQHFVREGERLSFRGFIDTDSLFTLGSPVTMTHDNHDQLVAPFQYKGATHYLLVKELNTEQQEALRSTQAA